MTILPGIEGELPLSLEGGFWELGLSSLLPVNNLPRPLMKFIVVVGLSDYRLVFDCLSLNLCIMLDWEFI